MEWKEWKLLFHLPLPLAVIALCTIGSIVTPTVHLDRLIITYLLVIFGLVFAGYSLDALYADWRPLITGIKQWQLWTLTTIGIVSFIGISIYATITTSITGIAVLLILIISIVCYNLEIPKWVHNRWGFSLTWGALPIVLSYYYQSLTISILMLPMGLTGFLLAFQEWNTTNTKSPMQQTIGELSKTDPQRRILRKETFKITSIYCYSLFALAMTLLAWRLV
jgi:hypothetical protein